MNQKIKIINALTIAPNIAFDDAKAERDPQTNYVIRQQAFIGRDGVSQSFKREMFSKKMAKQNAIKPLRLQAPV